MNTTWNTDKATGPQCDRIARDLGRKVHTPQVTALLVHWNNSDADRTKGIASSLIDALYQAPWAPRTPAATAAAPVTEAGMYRNAEGQVYRVKAARGSGKLYASELIITPEDGGNFSARFDYAAGAIYRLSAADRMTSEQAREIGHDFAICCVCAAELTNPVSVAAGIGPVCGGRV